MKMRKLTIGFVKRLGKALAYGLVGGFIVLVVVYIIILERRPDLSVWHEAYLDEEFTAHDAQESFEQYLAREDRLFAQLNELVYQQVEPAQRIASNRYSRGSLADPARWPTNWNRTFELPQESPVAGVLLLHGLSDSPYSLRSLGLTMHEQGAWVVGLRIPGHGTAPSGLTRVRWRDMAAAVRIAARHLKEKIGDAPLFIVGFSNGGALAVVYTIESLDDDSLPQVDRLVLISPMIGVSRTAAFAVWQARLGHLLGLKKLEWYSISPEYDAYKYGSFAVHAGDLSYQLTHEIQRMLTKADESGDLERFPPVLAFQSIADATVVAPDLVSGLFARLPRRGHELVLFDINRTTNIEAILVRDPAKPIKAMVADASHAIAICLVTNEDRDSRQVVARRWSAGESQPTETPLGMAWPQKVYSLSHVALPFAIDDPLYGIEGPGENPGIQIGLLQLQGERGFLRVPASEMLRIKWNPFYEYLEARTLGFTGLED